MVYAASCTARCQSARLCRFPSQGTHSGRERMLASRDERLEGTPYLFHRYHRDTPSIGGTAEHSGVNVMMELQYDDDYDDLPDEVVCAALRAAELGHSIELMELVDARPALLKARSRCARRQTLVMEAARWGRVGVVELLLRRGVEVNAHNAQGHTPLMQAAWNGRVCALSLLLDYGADASLQAVGSGDSGLMLAAKFGHVEAVQLLLRRGGVEVGVVNGRGRSALWWAACYGRSDVVRVLLSEGRADPCPPPGPHTHNNNNAESPGCGVVVRGEGSQSWQWRGSDDAAQVARRHNHHDCARLIEACGLPLLLHKARTVVDLPSPLSTLSVPPPCFDTPPTPPPPHVLKALAHVPPLLHTRLLTHCPLPSLRLQDPYSRGQAGAGEGGEEGEVLEFVLNSLPDSLYTELIMHLRPN